VVLTVTAGRKARRNWMRSERGGPYKSDLLLHCHMHMHISLRWGRIAPVYGSMRWTWRKVQERRVHDFEVPLQSFTASCR
jgi:hypothetical protein